MQARILVIDDDQNHREGLVLLLEAHKFLVDEADGANKAMELIRKNSYDLVITDFKMHEIDGMELLKLINDFDPLLKVIMVTGFSSIEHAVQAVHLGAVDYIPKPVDPAKLHEVISKVLKHPELPKENRVPERYIYFDEIIGKSRAIKNVVRKINEIAKIEVPVLIYGESGTGKELVARAIHKASDRKNEPFIAVNTGAIPKDLISSELFGHVKGAFTGAVDNKKGKFEEANGGTLFLDEISSMSQQVQISLLRVLENQKIDRVGGAKEIDVDVRIVAATNENMEDLIAAGKFREDLYYRLNVYNIELPPLRERLDDIPLISNYFLEKFNKEYKKDVQEIEEEAFEVLQKYSWPGNIRELRNILLRSLITANMIIKKKDMPDSIRKGSIPGHEIRFPAGTPLPDIERESIIRTLKMAKGNKLKAAEILGISRRSLYNKLEDYKIKDEEFN
jgi:DNA-binding NtrC family response regulator